MANFIKDTDKDRANLKQNGEFLSSQDGLGITPPPFQLKKSNKEEAKNQKAAQGHESSSNGIPFQLKEGIESMSGLNMNDVNVNYNSSKPAQLQAEAYAQGNDIHLAPGKNQHLPHEAWHIVQQKQNRVKPTTNLGGQSINNDQSLEQEADTMGAKAAQFKRNDHQSPENIGATDQSTAQLKTTNVTLPEKLGPTQEGPIAEKGPGDAHAFSPNDVNQGSIGDCYFLSSLIAVANNNPGLLQKAIKKNKDGTYSVKLYKSEQKSFLFIKWKSFTPVTIKLYPTFPISADAVDSANPNAATNPAHAQGGDADKSGNIELWVRLFEKAYAILLGSYKEMGNGGFGADALEAITGKEYKEEVLGDDSHERIIDMVKSGTPTNVGTSKASWKSMGAADKKFAKEHDIVAGHSYAVMSAGKSGLTVRNPWGEAASNAEVTLTWKQFDAMFNQFANSK